MAEVGTKVEAYQKTFENYETNTPEGSIFNLGEREWGVTQDAKAVLASSLDTCALVTLFDERSGSSLLGAVHYRSPKESGGAIGEIYRRLKDKDADVGVALVRGRLCSELSENFQKIKEELNGLGVPVPKETPQGPNGLFLTEEKTARAVAEAPQWIKQEISNFYKQQLKKSP